MVETATSTPNTTSYNAQDYEKRYQQGYGLAYPESHIIRVNKHILEWELKMFGGRVFDFGCGSGAHLRYFADHGYEPFGCDTSASAIEHCRRLIPEHADNFQVSEVNPDLFRIAAEGSIDVFVSNQVLYFLDDHGISDVVRQAYALLRPGGAFIATMMAPSCWYARGIVGTQGDFKEVNLDTPREKGRLLINFKEQDELVDLFKPISPLHVGKYGSHVRQEEGSTDHWLYVGVKR
jgi:SAM-dependent methyltransferase